MKINAKKLTGMLIALLVVLGAIALILPLVQLHAQASPATTLTLTDSEGNETTYDADASGAGWEWDASEAKLTLNGWSGKRIVSNGDLYLHLKGTNTLTMIDEYYTSGIHTDYSVLYVTADDDGVLNINGDLTNAFSAVESSAVITNGTINVNVTTESYGSSYGFYGSVVFDEENIEKPAVLNVNVSNTYDEYSNLHGIGNGGLEIANRDNVTVTVNVTGTEQGRIIAIYNLDIANSAAKVTAVANNNGGEASGCIAVDSLYKMTLKEGGLVDLTGYIIDYNADIRMNPNTVTTTPADNKYVYLKNKAVHNSYYVLSDTEGNPVEHTVFAYTDTPAEGLVWVGDGVIEVPSIYLEEYAEVNLLHGIRGGYDYSSSYWSCEILEGELPDGYQLFYSGATISGTPTVTCEEGTVKVRVKYRGENYWDESDDTYIDIDVKYGAVLEKDKFITIDGGDPIEMRTDATGEGWSYDGKTATLTLDGYNGGPIKAEKAFTILLKNENTITLSDLVLHDSDAYGILVEYEYSTKDLYVTAEAGGVLNIEGNITKAFSGIDAWFYLYSGTVNINIISSFKDGNTGYALANNMDFGEDDGASAAFFATLRSTNVTDKIYLYGAPNGGVSTEDRDNVTVGIYLYGATDKTELQGVSSLYMKNSGANVTIVVDNGGGADENCVATEFIGSLQLREGGRVDLTGAVHIGSSNSDLERNLNTAVITPADDQYCICLSESGDFAVCNLDGTYAGRTVFTYVNEFLPLKWVGNGRAVIPAGYVGQSIDYLYLWGYLHGGSGDNWKFEVVDGTLPQGLTFYSGSDYAYIYGTFGEVCEAGSITVRVTDTASEQSIEFQVPYGAVTAAVSATEIAFEQDTYIANFDEDFSVNVFLTPADTSNVEVTVEGNLYYSVEYLPDGQIVITFSGTTYAGEYTLTVTHTATGLSDTATVYVREEIPEIYIYDYADEELAGFDWGETYTVSGEGVTTKVIENATSYIVIDPDWFGKTLEITKNNTNASCNSPAQFLSIPARPAAPNVVGVDASKAEGYGKITGVDLIDGSLKYKGTEDTYWYNLYEGKLLLIGTYYVRIEAVYDKSFASEEKEIVIGYQALTALPVLPLPAGLSGVYYSLDLRNFVVGGCGDYTFAVEGECPAWLTCETYGILSGYRQAGDAATVTVRVTDEGDLEAGIDPASVVLTVEVGAVTAAGAHTCVYDQEVVHPRYQKAYATCTTPELYYMTCVCGDFTYGADFEHGAPLGHKFTHQNENDEALRSKGSNCQEYNTYWYLCETCYVVGDTLWFTSEYNCGDHDYSDKLSSISQYRHAYCCTVEGCGDYINSTSHTEGAAATENTPCTCAECDYVYQAALGHTIIRIAAKAATCTQDGNVEYYVCAAGCGKMFSDAEAIQEIADPTTVVIAALGHDYSEKLQGPAHYKTESDNCQEAHVYWFNCSRCAASARDDAGADDKYYTGTIFGDHHFDLENWGYQTEEGHAHLCTVEGCDVHDELKEHTTSYWSYDTNETHHWKECTVCHYHTSEDTHDYDDACDSYCNTCSEYREAPHDYDMETWYTSYSQHYRQCKLCTGSGYIADHDMSDDWTSDADEHWHECEICKYAKNYQDHSYDNNCDTSCNICDHAREITHNNNYLFEQQDATCSATGMKAHYQCNVCDTYFDAEKNETTEEALVIPIDLTAHTWGSWVTNGNGTNTHTRTCVHNNEHKENGDCSGGEATCTQKAICSSCNVGYGTLKEHTFGEKIDRVEATCVQNGMQAHYRCSACEGYFNEEKAERTYQQLILSIDPDAHDFGAWSSNGDGTHTRTCKRTVEHKETDDCAGGEATCTQKAVCTTCNAQYGNLKAHTFGDAVNEVPATHTSTQLLAGMKAHYRCTACESYFDLEKNPTTEGELLIPAPTHSFGEWITSDSEKHWKVCSCGLKDSEAAHEYDDESDMICNVCTHDRTVPHTHGEGEIVVGQAATCTVDGWKDYYQCSCGRIYTESACTNEITDLIAWKAGEGRIAASHTLGEKVLATEANCTATGMKEHYRCTVCEGYFDNEQKLTTAEALTIPTNDNHAFGAWASNGDGTHSRTCANNAEHKETVACAGGTPTCTEKAICSTCNTAYGQANGHSYSEATCTKKSTCSACEDEQGELAPHDYSEATCTQKATCSVCGDEKGELAPHNYSEATCTKKATCSACQAETGELAPHNYSEATCTKKATCSACGDEKGELAPHNYSEATCIQKATCSVCSNVKGDFAPHAYGELIAEVPATHTSTNLLAGKKAHYHCGVCNGYFNENKESVDEATLVIPAPVHTYGDWVKNDENHWKVCECGKKDAEAAHVYDDEADMICNTCEYDRTVPHTHGNGELVSGQAASCTVNGWKDYYQCSCGHIYTDKDCTNEITDLVAWKAGEGKIAASHTLGDLVAKVEANCTVVGKQAHYKCSVCGTFFDEEQNVKAENELTIPTNDAHSFGAWASNGDGTHSRVCANNAEHKETVACSGGTPTCTAQAICATCQTAYGDLAEHDYSEATCTKKATCSACGDEKGELVPHSYSEATCTKKATCSVCEAETGEFAEHNDANSDGKCDACQYQMTPTETTPEPEETTPAPEETTPPDDSEGNTSNPPEEPKEGLSGGAIAGIVVGSVAVAGAGGFAVWWFAVQKNTVAQLGGACKTLASKVGTGIKGLFEKMKNLFTKK